MMNVNLLYTKLKIINVNTKYDKINKEIIKEIMLSNNLYEKKVDRITNFVKLKYPNEPKKLDFFLEFADINKQNTMKTNMSENFIDECS